MEVLTCQGFEFLLYQTGKGQDVVDKFIKGELERLLVKKHPAVPINNQSSL